MIAVTPTVLPRRCVALALVAVVLLVGSYLWPKFRPAAGWVAGAPLEDLRRQNETLRNFDDRAAERAEARRRELRSQLWTAQQLDDWKQKIPSAWTIQEARPRQGDATITRRFVLTRSVATARDWPEIYGFLLELDALPTAVLHGLTLAMPQSQTRQFQTVQAVLDLSFRRPAQTTASGGVPVNP